MLLELIEFASATRNFKRLAVDSTAPQSRVGVDVRKGNCIASQGIIDVRSDTASFCSRPLAS